MQRRTIWSIKNPITKRFDVQIAYTVAVSYSDFKKLFVAMIVQLSITLLYYTLHALNLRIKFDFTKDHCNR